MLELPLIFGCSVLMLSEIYLLLNIQKLIRKGKVAFEVDDLAPLRPPIDNTQIFDIPPNIAFTEFSFLPIILFE